MGIGDEVEKSAYLMNYTIVQLGHIRRRLKEMLPGNVDTRPTLRSQDISMQGQATDQVSFLETGTYKGDTH